MNHKELLERIKETLAARHGNRLYGVVLYGSQSRGDATADSDIDILVLLRGPVEDEDDKVNIDALYPLMLELERPIHATSVDLAVFEAAEYPLYRNAKAEGVFA